MTREPIAPTQRTVILVTTDLAVGGAQSLMVAMARYFAAAGRRVTVVSLEGEGPHSADLRASGVRVIGLTRRWRWDLRPALQLRRIMRESRASCVICFGLYEYVFVRLGGWRPPTAPVMVSIHCMGLSGRSGLSSRRREAQLWLYARLLDRSTRLVAVCDAQAEYWSRRYRIARSRFVRIYNGIDTEMYRLAPDHRDAGGERARLGIPERAFAIVVVAALFEYKRHDVAMAALAQLRDGRSELDAHLICVGGDPDHRGARLRDVAAHLGVSEAVHFVGVQSDVRPFLVAGDVFTLTSTHGGETFSIAALEAMSTGLPAVLTDVGGAREMVADGGNGYVVPPEDAAAVARAWERVSRGELALSNQQISDDVRERFSAQDCLDAYLAMADSC